jgi:hypothetical protein
MKKVRKTYTLDERSAAAIERYAHEFHISASAFVSLMVTQIDQVLTGLQGVDEEEEEKSDAGSTGGN